MPAGRRMSAPFLSHWSGHFTIADRPTGGLIHHSDCGSQYLSLKYKERLTEAGIEPSVGSVGDSYDNALAETINDLYKAEVIHRRRPWCSFGAEEYATLAWVHWFNHHPVGDVSSQVLDQCVMEGLGGRFLDCPDHPFALAVGPWVIRLGKAMLDAVFLAGAIENVANPCVRRALVPVDELHNSYRPTMGHGSDTRIVSARPQARQSHRW